MPNWAMVAIANRKYNQEGLHILQLYKNVFFFPIAHYLSVSPKIFPIFIATYFNLQRQNITEI